MERTGFNVDKDYIETSRIKLKNYIIQRRARLQEISGQAFSIGQHALIKEIFKSKFGIELISTNSDEIDLFALQMTLAKKLNMPVIVHSRKGFKETSDVLKAIKWNRGVIHGYSYSKSELDFFLDLGWYISFSGAVTYSGKKNASDMAEIIAYVPKDRILIESDSPCYAPVPLKNTVNTPANMKFIYDYIASKRGLPSSKLSNLVDDNFKKLFL